MIKRIEKMMKLIARQFPWPVRKRILQAPPLLVAEHDADAPLLLISTTSSSYLNAIWTAYSLLFHIKTDIRLQFSVDGELTDQIRHRLISMFPRAEVVEARQHVKALERFRNIHAFGTDFKFGRKFCAVCNANQMSDIIYSDDDILFFKSSDLLASWISSRERETLYVTDREGSWISKGDPIYELAQAENRSIPKSFNSGFFLMPKATLGLALADCVLGQVRLWDKGMPAEGVFNTRLYMKGWEYFTEQSLNGFLLSENAKVALPENEYLHSMSGLSPFRQDTVNYEEVVMRHFTGPVRHRMYMNGMSAALQQMGLD